MPFETMAEVQSWLDDHINLEAIVTGRRQAPTLDRMRRLTELMAEPQRGFPIAHLTGTNGKGSTARMLTALFVAQGLSTGTYTSPHFEQRAERVGAQDVWRRGDRFECESNDLAVGGRLVTLRTPAAIYDDVFLPLHGAHQGDNAATALAAAEAFFGGPLSDEVVRE